MQKKIILFVVIALMSILVVSAAVITSISKKDANNSSRDGNLLQLVTAETDTGSDTETSTETAEKSSETTGTESTAESQTEETTQKTTIEETTQTPTEKQEEQQAYVPSQEVAVHNHSYTETSRKAATCSSTGSITYTCSCGDSYTETIPKTEHSWEAHYGSVLVIDTPYSSAKYTTHYYCGGCGADLGIIESAARAHVGSCSASGASIVEEKTQISPEQEEVSHYEEQIDYYYCKNCGERR